MENFSISYKILYKKIIDNNRDLDKLQLFFKNTYPNVSDSQIQKVLFQIKQRFLPHFNKKWNTCSRTKAKFEAKYSSWLEGVFHFNLDVECASVSKKITKRVGRPQKKFENCCTRAKRYKISQVRSLYSDEQIKSAAKSRTKAPKMHHIDADKALAIFIQTEMSKYQYQVLRQGLKKEGHDILPPYSKILDAKKRCYPESMTITDTSASIDLQELIDHTAKRLLHSMTEDEIAEIDDESLIMYSKWGCDGASGQCEYSQKLGDKELCDSNLFMTSIVPLNLSCRINNNVVWKNERPSSTRYCRCIQFQFAKETPEKIRAEKNRVDAEIAQIQDSVVDIRNRVFKVRHEFFFTMLDGKTAQAVTETPASSSCFICLATTSQMNCLEKIKARPINPEAIKFGMSPLHARIKFMEYILHIAYNLPIMCWKTNAETRPIKEKRKAQIQNEFAEKTGLRLDMVKQGKGTTNDGNTSRRFFANPALASEITGVKEEIINRCAVILEAITCTEPVDSCKFDNYAYDTAKMLVANYGWYNMPSSVHKVLLHGKQIIENCTFSVGALSEEAQECRNKDYKRYRNLHTRKCDRVSTNEDVMHMMLLSSDPFINKLRPTPKKKFLILSDEAKNLLRDINNNE